MSDGTLDLDAQRTLLSQMLGEAKGLCAGGDPFLAGHYQHLLERIETLLAILDIEVPEE